MKTLEQYIEDFLKRIKALEKENEEIKKRLEPLEKDLYYRDRESMDRQWRGE